VPRSVPEDGQHRTAVNAPVAQIVVEGAPYHLRSPLDYLVPDGVSVEVGSRVEVALRGRRTRGLVVGLSDGSELEASRLRPLRRSLGGFPWVRAEELELLRWAAGRYGAPLGDVVRHALPARVVDVERSAVRDGWWSETGPTGQGVGPLAADAGLSTSERWAPYGAQGAALTAAVGSGSGSYLWRPLPGEDVGARLSELVTICLAGGRDALLLVPDPASPTADMVLAAAAELGVESVDLRGGPGERATYRAWLRCRAGIARLVVGERGAAFMPLGALGLAVVLDEASPVHKERRSPRHHVREVVLERARRAGGVGLAVGTLPSAAAWGLIAAGRVTQVTAAREEVERRRPSVHLETGDLEARARLSRAALRVLREATDAGGYGVVLAARRGEGRSLVCTRCGDLVRCPRCAAGIARRADGGWRCASCGETSSRPPTCRRCGPVELAPLAAGAERIAAELSRSLTAPVAVLEGYAAEVPPPPAVLVMTRGSVLDRPPSAGRVLGVVLPDLDGSVLRPVLDAAEDAVRLAFAVSGWTVPATVDEDDAATGPIVLSESPRHQVVVETRDPEHHALRALEAWDPDAFWEEESRLRAAVRLPPAVRSIRLELRGQDRGAAVALRRSLAPGDDLAGPLPVDAGTVAFLIRTQDPAATLRSLEGLRDDLSRRSVDLRVDVDPVDLG